MDPAMLTQLTSHGNQFLPLLLKIKGTVKLNSSKNLTTARKATLNFEGLQSFSCLSWASMIKTFYFSTVA